MTNPNDSHTTLTKRELFASAFVEAMIQSDNIDVMHDDHNPNIMAAIAVHHADALISELNKLPNENIVYCLSTKEMVPLDDVLAIIDSFEDLERKRKSDHFVAFEKVVLLCDLRNQICSLQEAPK